jgi:hypothetical protein
MFRESKNRNTNHPGLSPPFGVFQEYGNRPANICPDNFLATLRADTGRNMLDKNQLVFDPKFLRYSLLFHPLAANVTGPVIIDSFFSPHFLTPQGTS